MMMRDDARTYALPFAVWELRLYLDTHPDDREALAQYEQLCAQLGTCSGVCVPDAPCPGRRWTWLDDPWPWDMTDGRCAHVDL